MNLAESYFRPEYYPYHETPWVFALMSEERIAAFLEKARASHAAAAALRAAPYPTGRKPYDWNAGLPKNIVQILNPLAKPSC